MKAGSISTLFVSALLVGWFAPGLKTAATDVESTPASQSGTEAAQNHLAVSRSDNWSAEQGVIARHPDGHFYTDAAIDGTRVRMLVDTGASVIALTGEDADALGITWEEESLKPIGRGASGVVKGIPVKLDRIEIEGIELRGVDAAIIPEGLDVSLLGQSFLSKVESVEISGDEMRLGG